MTASSDSQPVKPPAGRAAPRRMLWLLALLVVLAHWLLLDAIPREMTVLPAMKALRPTTLVFNTRHIEAPAVQVVKRVQATPPQPKPVLIQKLKSQPPNMAVAKPLMPPAQVADATSETPPAESVQTLPAEPITDTQTATDSPNNSTTADNAAAELPAASEQQPPQAQAILNIPASVRLNYKMTGLSRSLTYHASGVMTWQQDGNRYEASMVVSAFLIGSRTLNSVGDITADGLAPKRFSDKGRNELAAHFQADKGTVSFSANTPDAPWKRGAQDRLSVFLQLASLLAGQPESFALGTKIPIYTVGSRDVDTWTFSVGGEETLELPIGTVTAIKLTRDPRREFDQRVEAWFAPSLGYWPVRMKVTQHGGDYIDQQLSSSGLP